MSQSEARAWWADVQEVRETIERRRAAEAGRRPALRAVADPVDDVPAAPPPPPRRTVQITGRPTARQVPRLVEVERRRPARRPVERVGARPERLALWAVALCIFLILVAATSAAHAAI
jgi:hypothetical protein